MHIVSINFTAVEGGDNSSYAGSVAREVFINNIIVGQPTSLTASQSSQIFKVAFIGVQCLIE